MHTNLARAIGLAMIVASRADAQKITPATQRAVADSAASLMFANYVFPDAGRTVAAQLRRNISQGTYAGDTTPAMFAAAITRDVRAIIHDKHFTMIDPDAGRARMPIAAGAGNQEEMIRGRVEAERRLNFYFRKLEFLPGNVAYLAFDQFPVPGDDARRTATTMTQLMQSADAVILDLRQNRGGAEGLNQFLSSYFFDPAKPTVLYTRYHRVGDSTLTVPVLADLPGRRLISTPLYILTSRGTGSAAENMAYALQSLGRATLVGDTTAGAANSSRVFALPNGFALQVPIARVISPVTRTNWEGVGVIPNVRTEQAAALDTAYALALRGLLARATDESRRNELRTAARPIGMDAVATRTTPASTNAYVGRYGDRMISLKNGVLHLQRLSGDQGAGPELELAPIEADVFAIKGIPDFPDARVRFVRDAAGKVVELQVFGRDRQWATSRRTDG